jgi:trk system potassium uptake protein TrkA
VRVIVIGSGEVGLHISATLSGEGHDVTVLERDPDRSAEVQTELDALVVTGNGASPRVLEEQGAAHADLLLAVTDVDEVNMLAAAAAHQLGTKRTLARVREEDYVAGEGALLHEVLGVDVIIDPEKATADDLAETLVVPGAVHVEYFADSRLALAEVALRDDSPLAGTVVAERPQVRSHALVGILRHGQVMIPAAQERLEPHDHVFLAAAREDVPAVVASFDARSGPVDHAVVLGGGKVGLHLARRLEERGIAVKLFERDLERARYCAEHLPDSVVLQEDALSKETLLTHGVHVSDAFVACAGDDRTNLLAALHAKELGVRLCLAVVSSEQFVPLVDALGVDGAFSLRLTTAEAILRFVRADVVRALHLTLSGAEVLDLHADLGSDIVGAPARSVGRLRGVEVGAVLRGDRVIVPEGHERIEAGDRVLLFRLRGTADGVERAFDA